VTPHPMAVRAMLRNVRRFIITRLGSLFLVR
jgi:hypothetical protein